MDDLKETFLTELDRQDGNVRAAAREVGANENTAAGAGRAARVSLSVARSSALAPVRAEAIGSPCTVATRCRRSPQKKREWEAQ